MLPDDSKVDSFVSDRRKSRWVRLSIPIAAILVSVILAGRRYAAVASNEARLPFEEELALIYLILTILYEFSYFILRLFEGTDFLQPCDDAYLDRTVSSVKHLLRNVVSDMIRRLNASDITDAGMSKEMRSKLQILFSLKIVQWMLCVWKVFQETTIFARCRLLLKTLSVMPMLILNIALLIAASSRVSGSLAPSVSPSAKEVAAEVQIEAWLLVLLDMFRLCRDFLIIGRDLWKLFSYLDRQVASQGKRTLVVAMVFVVGAFSAGMMVLGVYGYVIYNKLTADPMHALNLSRTTGAYDIIALSTLLFTTGGSLLLSVLVGTILTPGTFSFLFTCLGLMSHVFPSLGILRAAPLRLFGFFAVSNLFAFVGIFRFLHDSSQFLQSLSPSTSVFCTFVLVYVGLVFLANIVLLLLLFDGVCVYYHTFSCS
jgi:hypothetical protein